MTLKVKRILYVSPSSRKSYITLPRNWLYFASYLALLVTHSLKPTRQVFQSL